MSDDQWRAKRRRDEETDFGPPLFGDDTESADSLSFDDSTGPLPHWTAPATGEMPKVVGADRDGTDDLDVWSSFSGQSPVWSDDDSPDPSAGYESVSENVRLGQMGDVTGGHEAFSEDSDPSNLSGPIRREPGRITIGTDPTDEGMGRPGPKGRGRGPGSPASANRGGRPTGAVRTTPSQATAGIGGRDMPMAIAVGAGLAAVWIVAVKVGPIAALVVVVLVITLAAVEFFTKVSEKGYQPASVIGIISCFFAPIVAYNYGDAAVPLVFMFAFIAGCVSFIGAPNLNSSPMPNMAITTLGITWIGLPGAFAGLILHSEVVSSFAPPHLGTDTLLIVAIAVVVNDIGALFVGSGLGKTPLRGWISPNKSVEGFIGGLVLTVVAMVVVGLLNKTASWDGINLIVLGVLVAIAAPLGDLTESMFKRNLDIKDFGSIVKGHGGVLDRFDGFLFTLPVAYYTMLVLQPWVPAALEFYK
ncbi:MAG: phosphatidate cytidylyltransferase [Ilumatobacteraceae bacterium]